MSLGCSPELFYYSVVHQHHFYVRSMQLSRREEISFWKLLWLKKTVVHKHKFIFEVLVPKLLSAL